MQNSKINNVKFSVITKNDIEQYNGEEKSKILSVFINSDKYLDDGKTEGNDSKLTNFEIETFLISLGTSLSNKFISWFTKYKEIQEITRILSGKDENENEIEYSKTNYDKAIKSINENNILQVLEHVKHSFDGTIYDSYNENDKRISPRSNEEIKTDLEHIRKVLQKYCKNHNIDTSQLDSENFLEFEKLFDYRLLIRRYENLIKDSQDKLKIEKMMSSDRKPMLQDAINKYYSIIDKNEICINYETIEDNELKEKYKQADLGNGKIDKKAIQEAGNCWLHGNIIALASNEAGEKFLENNIVKDDEKHIFAVFLQEAKDKHLPAPNGDGIYLITEKEIVQAQVGENALSFGDGDITAYALAADRLLKETGEKTDSESGNYSFRFFKMLSGLECKGFINNDIGILTYNDKTDIREDDFSINYDKLEFKKQDYDRILQIIKNHQGAMSFGYKGHEYSVVGVEDNNLLIQESNQAPWWEQNKNFEYIEGSEPPTYKLTKLQYAKLIEDIAIFKWQ